MDRPESADVKEMEEIKRNTAVLDEVWARILSLIEEKRENIPANAKIVQMKVFQQELPCGHFIHEVRLLVADTEHAEIASLFNNLADGARRGNALAKAMLEFLHSAKPGEG